MLAGPHVKIIQIIALKKIFTVVTKIKWGTICKMVTEVDNGFTAEKDISAYTKAASQAKPVVLGFNR